MPVKKAGKTAAKPAVTKKAAAPAKKALTIKEPLTKSQILAHVAEATELTKKQVTAVLEELSALIEGSIKPRGPGAFTLPGLLKVNVIKKPAKKARKGINPFTGEETMFKAKPAHNVVKIRALKKLKEMVE
ncbi:MAG: HU family DNA-binding protein [Pseudomonadota bacterium]